LDYQERHSEQASHGFLMMMLTDPLYLWVIGRMLPQTLSKEQVEKRVQTDTADA